MKKPFSISIYSLLIASALYASDEKKTRAANLTFKVELSTTVHDKTQLLISLNNPDEQIGWARSTYNSMKQTANLGIAVKPRYEKQGYGTMLWDKIMEELKKLGIKEVNFTAVPQRDIGVTDEDRKELVDWYKKRGAVVTDYDKDTQTTSMKYTIPQ